MSLYDILDNQGRGSSSNKQLFTTLLFGLLFVVVAYEQTARAR